MKLSARSRYATRILLELARYSNPSPMTAAMLSQRTGVSIQFVEQILKPLKQNGLTKSIRGAAGGHKLARSPKDIALGDVVRLMEGGVYLTVCCGEKANDCPRKEWCLTRRAWLQVSKSLENELDSITIEVLLNGDPICPKSHEGLHPLPAGKPLPQKKERPTVKNPRVIVRKARGCRRSASDRLS